MATFARINWKPSPKDLRLFAVVIACALGAVGSLMFWVFDREGMAWFLWGFGSLAFLTCITGTKIGLPLYWTWMGFVLCVSTLLGYLSLILTFFLVVTPIGLICRLFGRDRLMLRRSEAPTYWLPVSRATDGRSDRQF